MFFFHLPVGMHVVVLYTSFLDFALHHLHGSVYLPFKNFEKALPASKGLCKGIPSL